METLTRTVIDAVLAIAQNKGPRSEVAMGQRLREDLGFDSLDLAQVVAELELRLGFDPFARRTIARVETVEDLVDVYRSAERPGDGGSR